MQLPKRTEITVAPSPALRLVKSEVVTSGLAKTLLHQIVEKEEGGQEKVFEGLKEFMTTTAKGI